MSKKTVWQIDCPPVFPSNYLRVSSIVVSHECESARSSSSSLSWKIDISNLPIFLKERLQVLKNSEEIGNGIDIRLYCYYLPMSSVGKIVNPQRHHALNVGRWAPKSHYYNSIKFLKSRRFEKKLDECNTCTH